MDFTDTPEQEAWREEVRAFLKKHVTQELIDRCAEAGTLWDKDLYQKLADAGYIGVAIPKEFGGQGRSFTERAIFAEEMGRANVPLGVAGSIAVATTVVANALIAFGTEEQKDYHLPRIHSGEHVWSMGLTEPRGGSDLAGVETSAVEDGDDFVVTGTKAFNSAHHANHMFTVLRTNRNVPKHKGISLMLMDLRHPQISISPFYFISRWRVNLVHFDAARVSRSCLLGQQDAGWYQMMSMMYNERSMLGSEDMEQVFDELVAYVKHTKRGGRPLASYPDVRHAIAEMKWELTIARLLTNRVTWLEETGQFGEAHVQATLQKISVSETLEHIANRAMEIIGLTSAIEWENANETGKALSPIRGAIVRRYKNARAFQLGGGPNEIQRTIVARRGLGLPT